MLVASVRMCAIGLSLLNAMPAHGMDITVFFSSALDHDGSYRGQELYNTRDKELSIQDKPGPAVNIFP